MGRSTWLSPGTRSTPSSRCARRGRRSRRRSDAAPTAAERVGGRILEVGVGTGISLDKYSPRNRIVGIDLSEPMLRRAMTRVRKKKLAHVDTLAVMDAERLGFHDAYFDVVVAQ